MVDRPRMFFGLSTRCFPREHRCFSLEKPQNHQVGQINKWAPADWPKKNRKSISWPQRIPSKCAPPRSYLHTLPASRTTQNNKMAAIVASNFAVAAPSKVAARKISSRRAALPGTSRCDPSVGKPTFSTTNHAIASGSFAIGATRVDHARAFKPPPNRQQADSRPSHLSTRSSTVKRSVSVKAVRNNKVVARCVSR